MDLPAGFPNPYPQRFRAGSNREQPNSVPKCVAQAMEYAATIFGMHIKNSRLLP